MSTAEIRKELHSYIDNADEKFLKMVQALARSYEDEEEDYTLPGPPMDTETFRKRIIRASDRARAGHYTTSEDLEKEMELW
ncbi:MAG: hypothetical protein ACOYXB_15915 [Bacteroidota bacterium]